MKDYKCIDCEDEMGMKNDCEKCISYGRNSSKCPSICNIFGCVIGAADCKMECEDLKVTNSPICVLCAKQDSCSDERRNVLLGKKYMLHIRDRRKDDLLERMGKVRMEHDYLERRYSELKTDFYKTPKFKMAPRTTLSKKANSIARDLTYLRKILDMLGLKYTINVEIKEK